MVLYASPPTCRQRLPGRLPPGLRVALFLMIDLWPKEAGRYGCLTGGDHRRDAILALIMPAIILGGMFGGVYTPTEGAAVAVAYALVIGVVVYRSLSVAVIFQSLRESARTTGAVLFVVATASAVSWILTAEQAGEALRQVFLPFQASPKITMLLIAG